MLPLSIVEIVPRAPSQSRPPPTTSVPDRHTTNLQAFLAGAPLPSPTPYHVDVYEDVSFPPSARPPPDMPSTDFPMLDTTILDIAEILLPVNVRFRLVGYTDASFAVGEMKDSISGFVIYLNCTPIMWGSLTQTTVADSTCAAEFVAASVCCKCLTQMENSIRFLGFTCPKPYRLYTDSQASLSIANNQHSMGKIRHIQIRYHLVRGMVANGDIQFIFCVTEEMVADLLTKILSGHTFDHYRRAFIFLAPMFFNFISLYHHGSSWHVLFSVLLHAFVDGEL